MTMSCGSIFPRSAHKPTTLTSYKWMNSSFVSRLAWKSGGRCARLLQVSLTVALAASSYASSREPKFITQFYLVNDPASFESLRKNYTRISLVCPQWLSVNETGDLESAVDSSVIDWAGGKGVLLMPVLVNKNFNPAVAHSLLGDEGLQSKLITRIIELAEANHFFGIQFDLENIPDDDRDRYTQLIHRSSREFRRKNLKLSVAVVPPLAPPPAPHPLAP